MLIILILIIMIIILLIITINTIIIVMNMIVVRRTEGTEEQGVSDPEHLSLLAFFALVLSRRRISQTPPRARVSNGSLYMCPTPLPLAQLTAGESPRPTAHEAAR